MFSMCALSVTWLKKTLLEEGVEHTEHTHGGLCTSRGTDAPGAGIMRGGMSLRQSCMPGCMLLLARRLSGRQPEH